MSNWVARLLRVIDSAQVGDQPSLVIAWGGTDLAFACQVALVLGDLPTARHRYRRGG